MNCININYILYMKFIFVLVWKTSEPIKYEEYTILRKGGIFREYTLADDSIGQSCFRAHFPDN